MKNFMFLITLTFSINALGSNFSVYPLFLELDRANKNKQGFEINVKADGPIKVMASLYKAEQDRSGRLQFIKTENENRLKLKETRKVFNTKGLWYLNGEFYFSNENSTDVFAIMIEEDLDESKVGVNIRVRYAVVLKTQNSKKRVYENAILKNLKYINNKIFIDFKNETLKEQSLESSFIIRDLNKKLISKGRLNSISSWQNGAKKSIVFPKNEIDLVSDVIKVPQSGLYSVTINSKINGKRVLTTKKEIFLKEDIIKDIKKEKKIAISPEKLDVLVKSNNTALFKFKIENPLSEDIGVEFPKNENFIFIPSNAKISSGESKTFIFKVVNAESLKAKKSVIQAEIKNSKLKFLKLPFNLVPGK